MAYFHTVLTYQLPSEAELDKSFLEAQGITVYLMNNQTTRNELGPAFWIQLQVAEEDWPVATQILREARPDRFGSAERVNEIDRVLKRGALRALAGATILGVSAYLVVSAGKLGEASYWETWEQPVVVACLVGAVAGWRLGGKSRRGK
jgi:hypothetical protein